MREDSNLSLKYMDRLFAKETPLTEESIEFMESVGKEGMSVSPSEASFLAFLVKLSKATKVVEIGCFAGYSALWMAGAMKEGSLYTFEFDKKHFEFSKALFEKFEGPAQIQVFLGDARQELSKIENEGPFDLVFIDANKAAYYDYLLWAEKNLKKGGFIVGDNSLLFDQVGLEKPERVSNAQWTGMRKFNEYLAQSDSFESCFIPTSEGMSVGIKK